MNENQLLGFWLAVIASIPFAAYILPRKLSRLPVLEYQCWLGASVAPFMLILAFLFGENLSGSFNAIALAFLCGPLWAFGSICYAQAVDHIGVARSTPIKNLAPMWASIYGILLFREYSLTNPLSLFLAVAGTVLMIVAAQVLGKASAPKSERAFAYDVNRSDAERAAAYKKGWVFSFATAAFYGAYSVPLKLSLRDGLSALSACAWLGIGVFVTSVFCYWISQRKMFPKLQEYRELKLTAIAGVIWSTAQICGTLAMLHVAMSISWPVSNLSTLIAIGWGVWIFKEVRIEEHKKEVWISMLVYCFGLVVLALAAGDGRV